MAEVIPTKPLVLEFTVFDPRVARVRTFRLKEFVRGDPFYEDVETKEMVPGKCLLKLLGVERLMMGGGSTPPPVPARLLPDELLRLRHCPTCGKYSYEVRCPYDDQPTGPVTILYPL